MGKKDVLSSKYPELDIEETTYWPEKRPYWNIKNTPKVSEYNSAFKSRELKTDEIEIKPMENIEDSHMNQDIKPISVRSKIKTIKDDEDLIIEPQIHSSEREKESDIDIDESKIWEMASLRYLGPKDETVTQDDNIIQKNNLTKQQTNKEDPIVKSQKIEESFIPNSTEMEKDTTETSGSIEPKVLASENADKYESLYSKYSITSSEKGTSLQKPSELAEEENCYEPYKSREQKENIDISNLNKKVDKPSNISSNSDWESLLSSLDRKLDFASNLLNMPSTEMISGATESDTADKGLSVPCEVADTTKMYEKD